MIRVFKISLPLIILILVLPSHALSSGTWEVVTVLLPSQPEQIILKRKRKEKLKYIRIRTRDGAWYRLKDCETGICAIRVRRDTKKRRVPLDALPDTRMTYGKRNITRAWLSKPTNRYRHGVLGDSIEAGALSLIDKDKKARDLNLDLHSVFEDLEVRLADLDKDGDDEIIVVKSYLREGAALAVVELRADGPIIAAETPPIGLPHRWLNPAGIADFDGDGWPEIALVMTPHIGGVLQFWSYRDRQLKREMQLKGFSNHVIGSRIQSMSAVADFDGDKIKDIAVPDGKRSSIRIISLAQGHAAEPARIPLPGQTITEMFAVQDKKTGHIAIVVGLNTKQIAVLRQVEGKAGAKILKHR